MCRSARVAKARARPADERAGSGAWKAVHRAVSGTVRTDLVRFHRETDRVELWAVNAHFAAAPGSRVVTDYYEKAGMWPYLEKLGFAKNFRGHRQCSNDLLFFCRFFSHRTNDVDLGVIFQTSAASV